MLANTRGVVAVAEPLVCKMLASFLAKVANGPLLCLLRSEEENCDVFALLHNSAEKKRIPPFRYLPPSCKRSGFPSSIFTAACNLSYRVYHFRVFFLPLYFFHFNVKSESGPLSLECYYFHKTRFSGIIVLGQEERRG